MSRNSTPLQWTNFPYDKVLPVAELGCENISTWGRNLIPIKSPLRALDFETFILCDVVPSLLIYNYKYHLFMTCPSYKFKIKLV